LGHVGSWIAFLYEFTSYPLVVSHSYGKSSERERETEREREKRERERDRDRERESLPPLSKMQRSASSPG
jgi:hypothetical protein